MLDIDIGFMGGDAHAHTHDCSHGHGQDIDNIGWLIYMIKG
jgi:hypothetical protein